MEKALLHHIILESEKKTQVAQAVHSIFGLHVIFVVAPGLECSNSFVEMLVPA